MTSGQGKTRKRRSLALSAFGIENVNSAIRQALNERQPGKKLSRSILSQLMGVSERTCDKILDGERVDRATHELVLTNLSLAWNDDFFIVEVSDEPINETELPNQPEKSRFNLTKWTLSAIAGLILASACFAFFNRPKLDDRWELKCNAFYDQGMKEYQEGKYAASEHSTKSAFEMASQHKHAGFMAMILKLRGNLKQVRGDLLGARKDYTWAFDLSNLTTNEEELSTIHHLIGVVDLRLGNADSAKEHFLHAIRIFSKYNLKPGVAEAQRDLGQACYIKKDYLGALTWYASARESLRGIKNQEAMRTDIESREAMVLRDQGNLKEAREKLIASLKFWQSKPHPRWIARTQMQLGSVEVLAGNMPKARSYLTASSAAFAELGDPAGKSEAEEWLRRCVSVR